MTYTTFQGHQRIASGLLPDNAIAARRALDDGSAAPVLIFDNATGCTVDVDLRGSDDDLRSRLAAPASEEATPRGRGRPKLGVVAREVTLLPRHWEWLAAQPGGASVVLRRLVDEARRAGGDKAQRRQALERAYHFMLAIAGDLPGYEEATRALFADDAPRTAELLAAWPPDVRDHALQLAFGEEMSA